MIAKHRGYVLMAMAAGIAVVGWWLTGSPASDALPALDRVPASTIGRGSSGGVGPRDPLPAEITRPRLECAERDPFTAVLQQPVVDARPPQPSAVVVATPQPTPQAPTLSLQFAGRVVGPDGQQTLYVTQGTGLSQLISVGQTLSTGYEVEAISATAIELRYPPLNTAARLELPPPPRHEIR